MLLWAPMSPLFYVNHQPSVPRLIIQCVQAVVRARFVNFVRVSIPWSASILSKCNNSLQLVLINQIISQTTRSTKELALASQPWSIYSECKGNRYHRRRQASKQGTCPLHPHNLKHLLGEQGESGGDCRAEYDVCCHCRRCSVIVKR